MKQKEQWKESVFSENACVQQYNLFLMQWNELGKVYCQHNYGWLLGLAAEVRETVLWRLATDAAEYTVTGWLCLLNNCIEIDC